MRAANLLDEFVKDAIAAGQSQSAITAALKDAGWSDAEIGTALGAWQHAGGNMPPVPQPRPYVSARDVVFFGLLFVSLAALCWHIVVLGFSVIEAMTRDLYEFERSSFGMRWSIAALIVFVPLFVFLDWRLMRRVDKTGSQKRSLVRRWFASVTLLLSLLVLIGDLVATTYAGLTGELTLRLLCKTALVAVVAALTLAYCRGEVRD